MCPKDATTGDVSAVAIKLPTFWSHKANIWFAQAEAQFSLRGITGDETKYAHIVSALDENSAERVLDILEDPPSADKYNTLKARLLNSFKLSPKDKAAQILDLNGLGDMKPSALADKILALASREDVNAKTNFLIREIFLRQLPAAVRGHVENKTDVQDLRELAKIADAHIPALGACSAATASRGEDVDYVNAAKQQQQRGYAFKPRKPAPSQQEEAPLCFYHKRFGDKANKCTMPCTFKQQGNGAPARQ